MNVSANVVGILSFLCLSLIVCSTSVRAFEREEIAPFSVCSPGPEHDILFPLGALAKGEISLTYDSEDMAYVFRLDGDSSVEYRVDFSDAWGKRGILHISETISSSIPVYAGGTIIEQDGRTVAPEKYRDNTMVTDASAEICGSRLVLEFIEEVANTKTAKTYEIELIGKALRISIFADSFKEQTVSPYRGFTLGPQANVLEPESVRIPYMSDVPITRFISGNKTYYISTPIDWTQSRANERSFIWGKGPRVTTDGKMYNSWMPEYVKYGNMTYRPVVESVWVTVSEDLNDMLLCTNNMPSPYFEDVAKSIVLIFGLKNWNEYLKWLDLMHEARVKDLSIYLFHWTVAGLNRLEPTYYQDNPNPSEDALMRKVFKRALDYGHRIGVYTSYQMLDQGYDYMHNPNYDPADAVLDQTGRFRPGWNNTIQYGNKGHINRVLAPDAALKHARRENRLIKDNYNTNLGYIDVVTAWHPAAGWVINAIDLSGQNEHPDNIRDVIIAYKRLFLSTRETFQGPVLGEGASGSPSYRYDSYYAGYVDSVQATLSYKGEPYDPDYRGTELIMPDYAQTVLRRKQANHGMGFYSRFFVGEELKFPLSTQKLDRYRAFTIAYANTGYFDTHGYSSLTTMKEQVKEYYVFSALQSQYFLAETVVIHYDLAGEWVGVSDAVAHDYDFSKSRLWLEYSNGLDLYMNFSDMDMKVQLDGYDFRIPKDGWVAFNQSTGYLGFSAALEDGYRFDYVRVSDSYEMIDGRGKKVRFGNVESDKFLVVWSDGRTIREVGSGEITVGNSRSILTSLFGGALLVALGGAGAFLGLRALSCK